MKDEIKEILDNINNKWEDYKEKTKQLKYVQDIVSGNDFKQLLDYITNLQTIEQQYSALLSENAELENRIKELEQINEEHRKINGELREENKRLKEENKHIFANVNDDQLLRSNAMNYVELQDYKTRINKAIEYIEKNSFDKEEFKNWFRCFKFKSDTQGIAQDLLNILQNGEENE